MSDNSDFIVKSRAIVATRNSQRVALLNMDRHLNSEIDVLADLVEQIANIQNRGELVPKHTLAQMEQTLGVLKMTFPLKKPELDVAFRMLLVVAGLERLFL